ncbi:class I SAM-dependent methyltransferase [Marinilactibacillus kalidii]|uniref:class I SAM-dependent methyltransferase n=1 Tax=Marinilactibacillus kalidii TaxID=2820274 RepID=UPI001ABEC9C5
MSQYKEKLRVVIGSGGYNNNPGWLHTQENEINLIEEKSWESQFEYGSIEAILAEHVWEHLSVDEGSKAAKICYRYLKPGGYIRCAVPDGNFRNKDYQHIIQVGGPGPTNHPASSHKVVYNFVTLARIFEEAGFEINFLEYHDENGEFHYENWEEQEGVIYRSRKIDPRNQAEAMLFPSLMIDAEK